MNRFPCPACGKALWWNGIAISRTQFNLEGKRWFQYAGRRIHCKRCGVRLRGPLEGRETWLLLAWLAFVFLVNPWVIEPLTKQFGMAVPLGFFAVVLGLAIIVWQRGQYKKWDDLPP